jgi:hypothetical protein
LSRTIVDQERWKRIRGNLVGDIPRLETAFDGPEGADVNGYASAVGDHLPGKRGDARAGSEDPNEVQRVGGGYHDRLRLLRLPA